MTSVLVVGDDDAQLTMVRWILEDEGYIVSHARRADVALVQLHSCAQALVVLLLTVRPHVNACSILDAALGDPAVRRHELVSVTGICGPLSAPWRAQVAELHVPLLAKPFHIAAFVHTIAAAAARLVPADEYAPIQVRAS
jgi:CheY-like chemotaxis protein